MLISLSDLESSLVCKVHSGQAVLHREALSPNQTKALHFKAEHRHATAAPRAGKVAHSALQAP